MIYSVQKRKSGDTSDITITEGSLSLALDEAGSLTLTLYNATPAADDFKETTWTVRQGDKAGDATKYDIIFAGRPTEETVQYDGALQVYCEGSYAYMQDYPVGIYGAFTTSKTLTVSDDKTEISGSPADLLAYVLNAYNSQASSVRKIASWDVDMPTDTYKISIDYGINCMEAVSALRDTCGGHMYMTWIDDISPVLHWYKDTSTKWPKGKQPVALGRNITDGTKTYTLGEPTLYMPLGNEIEAIASGDKDTQADDTHVKDTDTAGKALIGQRLTLTNRTDVNKGSNYIGTGYEATYGNVIEVLDIQAGTAAELLKEAKREIAAKIVTRLATNVDAADLHYAKGYEADNPSIDFPQTLSVAFHGDTVWLMVSSMDIDLYSASKTISLGDRQRTTGDLSSMVSAADKTASKADKTAKQAKDKAVSAVKAAQSGSSAGTSPSQTLTAYKIEPIIASPVSGIDGKGYKYNVLISKAPYFIIYNPASYGKEDTYVQIQPVASVELIQGNDNYTSYVNSSYGIILRSGALHAAQSDMRAMVVRLYFDTSNQDYLVACNARYVLEITRNDKGEETLTASLILSGFTPSIGGSAHDDNGWQGELSQIVPIYNTTSEQSDGSYTRTDYARSITIPCTAQAINA